MINASTIAALRTTPPINDGELRESIRGGWMPEHPAVRDEHGVVLIGNRRLRLAAELGIEPIIETRTYGDDEKGDDQRIRVALASNISSGVTAEDRKALAISLFKQENWTQKRIALVVRVSQKTISQYLDGIYTPGINSPPRAEKRGRPMGSGKAPKPIEARVSPIGKITEPTIDPATLSLSAQQKLEAHKRRLDRENEAYRRKLEREHEERKRKQDLEFEERVRAEGLRRDQIWLGWELEAFDKARRIEAAHRGVMTKAQYRDLQRCLHTDTLDGIAKQGSVDPTIRKRFDATLGLVINLEAVLVKAESKAPPMPTMEEMMRRRAEYDAKNRERAQRAAATRKANAAKQEAQTDG